MASGTCRYSFECRPPEYSKWPSRRAPVSRSTDTTSSWVGIKCMSNPWSVGAPPGQDARNRAHQDFPIESQRPIINVLHIHLHPGLKIEMVAAGDRPEAGEAGTHAQAPALPSLVLVDFTRDGRSRPDQGHVAAKHVPKLRPLIDRELPQITADGGEARVVRNLERRLFRAQMGDCGLEVFRVFAHRAELVKHEPASVQTAADLAEDRRPG